MQLEKPWTQAELIQLCILLEAHCPQFGCHVAMTGGCLYKSGARKDADIILYRIRQTTQVDLRGLFNVLRDTIGFDVTSGWGWIYRATYGGKPVDVLIPEEKAVMAPDFVPTCDPVQPPPSGVPPKL